MPSLGVPLSQHLDVFINLERPQTMFKVTAAMKLKDACSLEDK